MIPNNYYISTFIRFSIEQGLREYIYKFIMLFLNEYKTCSLLCFPAPERRVDESYFLLRLVRLDLSKKKKCQRASCMHACACMGDFLRQLARSPCANEFFFKKNKQFRMFLYFAGTVAENTQPCITFILIFYAGIDRVKVSNSNSFLPDLIWFYFGWSFCDRFKSNASG
jgi:hypothetical protein